MTKNFLNPKGHQNVISGSKVTAILLKGWILPISGVSVGEGLRLQPARQSCLLYVKPIRIIDKSKYSYIGFKDLLMTILFTVMILLEDDFSTWQGAEELAISAEAFVLVSPKTNTDLKDLFSL